MSKFRIINSTRRGVRKGRLALLFLLGVAIASNAAAIQSGEKAPNLPLTRAQGGSVSLSQFKGKVVYVDFWATWCAPCRHSLPWMNEIQKKYASKGLVVLAINEDTEQASAMKVLAELNPDFTPLFDADGIAAKTFALPTMPSSFIVDREGVVKIVHPGFKDGDKEEIEAQLGAMLSN